MTANLNRYFTKYWPVTKVFFLIFVLGIVSGLLTFEYFREDFMDAMESIGGKIVIDSKYQTFVNLLVNNSIIALLCLLLGFTVVLPVAIIFVNGAVLGMAVPFASEVGIPFEFLLITILPHGVIEIPTIVFYGAVSAHIGLALLFPGEKSRLKAFGDDLKDAVRIYVLFVIPLIIIAAMIEAFVTMELVT